jgi:hypothetical protein
MHDLSLDFLEDDWFLVLIAHEVYAPAAYKVKSSVLYLHNADMNGVW